MACVNFDTPQCAYKHAHKHEHAHAILYQKGMHTNNMPGHVFNSHGDGTKAAKRIKKHTCTDTTSQGATGSGVANDAALRGLKTAVVEMDDFASGTSSKSTKLIHGGIRYLALAFQKVIPPKSPIDLIMNLHYDNSMMQVRLINSIPFEIHQLVHRPRLNTAVLAGVTSSIMGWIVSSTHVKALDDSFQPTRRLCRTTCTRGHL
jgi:hypothetical protein